MRSLLQIASGDVLEIVSKYEKEKREEALNIIDSVECEGRERLALQPGLFKLLRYLHREGIKKALLTRNSKNSVVHFIEALYKKFDAKKREEISDFLNFEILLDRDHEHVKPNPLASLFIAKKLDLSPEQILFVGDSLDDLSTARSAGNLCAIMKNESNRYSLTKTDINFFIHIFILPQKKNE